MLDGVMRAKARRPLDAVAAKAASVGVSAQTLTLVGLVVGLSACAMVAWGSWWFALALWGTNRCIDGLDGAVARLSGPTDVGGFLDIAADFCVYGAMAVAFGYAVPEARLAALFVLFGYYLSGSFFLASSALAAKAGTEGDGRSFNFPPSLAEGTETIIAYVLLLLLPGLTTELLWIWAAVVGFTALQRVWFVVRNFSSD